MWIGERLVDIANASVANLRAATLPTMGRGADLYLDHFRDVVLPGVRRRADPVALVAWEQQRILDIGCGHRYPSVVLLHGTVERIDGVDTGSFWRDGVLARYRDHRAGGRVKAAVHAVVDQVYGWRFYSRCAASGVCVQHSAYGLRTYDGCRLPLSDGAFTFVMSNAVLEHVENLDAFARETSRVLEAGGTADHVWHNYYALSGDHGPESAYRRKPWGHLSAGSTPRRGLFPRTPSEMLEVFARYFDVVRIWRTDRLQRMCGVDEDFEEEGAELYDEALSARPELGAHPRELLVTRAYAIQLRKPVSG